jgi:riboflavin biosynthesis pyrimidine reductase
VSSLDGVVALGPEYPSSGSAISGREPSDRFVMGLLRAFADAVLIGAGTLRATPNHRWTPEHLCPSAAAGFAALRETLGCAPDPELIVVTASGDLPLEHPALQKGAVIVTTAPRGAPARRAPCLRAARCSPPGRSRAWTSLRCWPRSTAADTPMC